jgi:hypothetical protein
MFSIILHDMGMGADWSLILPNYSVHRSAGSANLC